MVEPVRVSDSLRPVGHITDLIKELDKWAAARDYHHLRSQPLRKAMAYLEEYRQLTVEVRDA